MHDTTLVFSYPRIQINNCYKFTWPSAQVNSAKVRIYDPNAVEIDADVTHVASYDPVNSYYYFHHTACNSWYTTVSSFGGHTIKLLKYTDISSGWNVEERMFEVIRIKHNGV